MNSAKAFLRRSIAAEVLMAECDEFCDRIGVNRVRLQERHWDKIELMVEAGHVADVREYILNDVILRESLPNGY